MRYLGLLLSAMALTATAHATEPTPDVREVAIGTETAVFRKVSPRQYRLDYPDFYFLETEVTNRLYREYLRAAGEHKDDFAVVEQDRVESEQRRRDWLLAEQAEKRASKVIAPVMPRPTTLAREAELPRTIKVDVAELNLELRFPRSWEVVDRAMLWQGDEFPAGMGDHPVAFLTPAEAAACCDWLSRQYPQLGLFRLPTWNEWMIAAYGRSRAYPWGGKWDRSQLHSSHGLGRDESRTRTEPARNPFRGRTPEGLYGMLGNVSEYLTTADARNGEYFHLGSRWMGGGFQDGSRYAFHEEAERRLPPREDYWGYRHEFEMRDQEVGFRVLLDPTNDPTLLNRPRLFGQRNNAWRTESPPAESKATAPGDEINKTPATPDR